MSSQIKTLIKQLQMLYPNFLIQLKDEIQSISIKIEENHALPICFIELNIESIFNQYTLTLYKKVSEQSPPIKLLLLKERGAIDFNTLFKTIKEMIQGIIKEPKPDYYPC